MADNSMWSDIIKGIIVGAVILIIFSKRSEAQPLQYPYDPTQFGFMEQQKQQKPMSIYDWKPLDHIPSVDDLRIAQPTIQPVVQDIARLCPQCSNVVQKVQEPGMKEMKQIQENEENWNFQTDAKGRITGVSVHRKLYSIDDKK